MVNFWDERYRKAEYAYGESPNAFFKQQLDQLKPAKLLLPAEGEGRNAVYACLQGWEVTAFDQSIEGKRKAENLANSQGVGFNYLLGSFAEMNFPPASFDAVALIYAHWPAAEKPAYHRKVCEWLKPDGIVILEAFSTKHLAYQELNPTAGGPKEEAMLYDLEELRQDFAESEILHLAQMEISLSEGQYHQGLASVVRLVARKKG